MGLSIRKGRAVSKYRKEVKDYVLDRIDIVTLVGQYVDLKRAGRSHKGLCPFHGEKTPSFIVSEERGSFHCFGCGTGGDSISFVMQKENLGFIDALEFLADRFSLDLSQFLEADNRQREADTKPLYEVMRQAALFYYKQLGQSAQAIAYLKGREISPSILKAFGVGFAPEGWDHLLQHLKGMGVSENLMLQAGLVVKKESGGYYDRFRNRIMFPIFDYRGRVVAFGGRVLDDSHPKYLNSPETPIFNKSKTLYGLHVARKHPNPQRQMLLVEGYMDTISLHQFGFQNAVATLGTALTDPHARELKKLCDEVIFAYDADNAGQNAIARSLEVLKAAGLRVKVLHMEGAKDPDEYLKRQGTERFGELIRNAMNTVDFSLKRLESGYNLKDDDQRLQYLEAAYGLIAGLPSKAEQDVYIDNLARRTGINAQALHEDYGAKRLSLEKAQKESGKSQKEPVKSQKEPVVAQKEPVNPQREQDIALDQDFEPLDSEALLDLMDSMPGEFFDDAEPREVAGDKNFEEKDNIPLINDPKLATIEKALLKCALLSKPYYVRVKEKLAWGFHHPVHQRDFEAIGGYYQEADAFEPVLAASVLSLDLVTRLQAFHDASVHVGSLQDVDKLIHFHHKHFCEVKIKAIDQELQVLKLRPGDAAMLSYREKMVERIAVSKELAQAVKAMQHQG